MDTPVSLSQRLSLRHKLSIIGAQFFVVTPHFTHLPAVLSVLAGLLVVGLFYWYKYKKRDLKYPRWYQAIVVMLGMTTILLTYRTLFGVEAGVAFLMLCLLGKLLELNARRDAYIALTLSLFVISGLFLFEQSIAYTLLALVGILAVLWAMVAQNLNPDYINGQEQQADKAKNAKTGKRLFMLLTKLMLQAVPLLIVLFIFFPRIPPLWSVPLSSGKGITGISDQMSPGDLASLGQSSQLAFRVLDKYQQINKNLPPQSQLYWRGITLSHFDGTTWKPLKDYRLIPIWSGAGYIPEWFKQNFPKKLATGFEYKVILQPTNQPWLFALDTPFSMSPKVGLSREYNLASAQDVYKQFNYDVIELKNIQRDVYLPDWLLKANLQLPEGSNPRTQQIAQQVFQKMGNQPEKYIEFWLNWIKQQNFAYTLQPPLLTGQRVDQFLFQTRRGFCEHYASAFTVLMRAVGIPAHVVVGYQGGELSPDKQSLEVRQMDAHAWVEVWLAGKGWVRIDPTAAIAPERVEQGMNRMLQQDQRLFGDGAINQLKYNQMKWIGQVRVWSDYASYIWQRDVVGFDKSAQEGFLQRLLGIKSLYAQVMWLFGLVVLTISLIVGWLWWKRRRVWHPVDAPLQRLSKRLSKQNLQRLEAEGVIDWLNRLAQQEAYRHAAQQLIQLYQQARYNDVGDDSQKKLLTEIALVVRHWPKKKGD